MPDSSTYSGVPIPTDSEAPTPTAAFAPFRAAIDPQLVLKATSVSNRDTLYGGTTGATAVPLGTLVSCGTLKTVWQKTSTPPAAAAWITVAEQGTAVTTGVMTAATDFTVTTQAAQRLNGINWVRGRLTYSGATITAPAAGGNIADTACCTIQSAWLPGTALGSTSWLFTGAAGSPSARFRMTTAGAITIDQLASGAVLTSGDAVAFDISYPGV